MEQNREQRNKPSYIWSTNHQQGLQDYTMEKESSFQQIVLGKSGNYMTKLKLNLYCIQTYKVTQNRLKPEHKT